MTVGTNNFTLCHLSENQVPRSTVINHLGDVLNFDSFDVIELKNYRISFATVSTRIREDVVVDFPTVLVSSLLGSYRSSGDHAYIRRVASAPRPDFSYGLN